MHKTFIIGTGIASILLVAVAVFFFSQAGKEDSLLGQRDVLQSNLSTLQTKLNKSKDTLGSMRVDLNNAYPLGVSVQDQMRKTREMIRQTDFLFTNADGSSPELIIKNSLALDINKQRAEINLMLLRWQGKGDILALNKIDVSESLRIRKEAQAIRKYIEDLINAVESLDDNANSALSQGKINTYLSQLPSVESFDEVLAALDAAIENSETQRINAEHEAVAVSGSSSSSGGSTSSPIPTDITPEQVLAQQIAVAEAEAEVAAIQEQIRHVDQEIESASPPTSSNPSNTSTPSNSSTTPTTPTPPTTPVETVDTPVPDTGTPEAPAPTETDVPTIILPPRERVIYQGIIIQPGPSRLIQGTDPY